MVVAAVVALLAAACGADERGSASSPEDAATTSATADVSAEPSTTGDGTGWVNLRFLSYLGAVDDLTAEVVRRNEGEISSAETMEGLGLIVAEVLDHDDDQEASRTVMTVAPSTGDLGEVTFDVIGLADDAQVGRRLHVFGAPEEGSEGFGLKTVEATLLCGRGVAENGRCI